MSYAGSTKTFSSAGDFVEPNVDENGYSKFQAHELMNRLGSLMMNGFKVPFETDVLFDDNDLYEYKK